jgi:hypothetical protein
MRRKKSEKQYVHFELGGREYRILLTEEGLYSNMFSRRHRHYDWTRMTQEDGYAIWAQREAWLRENEWSGI